MSFQRTGAGAPDATFCRYGGSRLQFRGPRRRPGRRYLACLGGAETFGRFVGQPFAAHLEQALGLPVVNLGSINAGLDAFLAERQVLDLAAGAQATVVQLTGVQNLSNPFYRVHPRRNDRVIAPSEQLTALFPEVDFTEVHFTRHLLSLLRRTDPIRFSDLRVTLRMVWLARTGQLLRQLGSEAVLLWLRYPDMDPEARELGPEPLMVDRPLISALRPQPRTVVEVPVSPAIQTGDLDMMSYAPMERPAAEQALGPAAHHDIANRLMRALRAHA